MCYLSFGRVCDLAPTVDITCEHIQQIVLFILNYYYCCCTDSCFMLSAFCNKYSYTTVLLYYCTVDTLQLAELYS